MSSSDEKINGLREQPVAYEHIARCLAPDELADELRQDWEASQMAIPETVNDIGFLQERFVDDWNDVLRLTDEMLGAFYEAVRTIRSHPGLCRLVWHGHWLLANRRMPLKAFAAHWPKLPAALGKLAGMPPAILTVSLLPEAAEFYKSRGIPRRILIDTFRDVRLWLQDYYNKRQEWGILPFSWLLNSAVCDLFRLGRLQFMRNRPFAGKCRVFRRDSDGSLLVLPAEDADPAKEWRPVLSPGDPILEIHIPDDGKLHIEECGDSFRQAMLFFPKFFPEYEFRAFTCQSWLMDAQYGRLLGDSSNIVRFQRLFTLLPPGQPNPRAALERIFGGVPEDLAAAPRNTSLQRAVLDHLQAGGSFYGGYGFILKEDI